MRCGACRSICPTFRVLGRETAAARGKLTLVEGYLEGRIDLSEAYIKHIKECTMCGGCRTSCPRGVDTTAVFNAARADAVKKKGLSFAESFVMKNMLDYTGIMPRALKYASRLKGLLFKGSAVEHGLISRFSMPLVGGGRLVPELAETFFLDLKRVKGLGAHAHGKRGKSPAPATKVAFYAGCGVNFLMPGVGLSSIDALMKAGLEVVVPASQVCCGMPAYYSGDVETAKSLALKNLKVFEDAGAEYIVTSCATCSHGLKNVFREILSGGHDPEMNERVERFSSRVRDITEFLATSTEGEDKGAGPASDRGKKIVTYHDPCHLNRNQGIRDEPRELLKKNKNIEFREMRFPCSCCGLGAGVSLTNYELSINITKRKADSIRDSGADIVATACPGCIVQLRDGLHKYGVDAKVMHVVELL